MTDSSPAQRTGSDATTVDHKRLDGRVVAQAIRDKVQEKVAGLTAANWPPRLGLAEVPRLHRSAGGERQRGERDRQGPPQHHGVSPS
jgi:hypothetical protein